MGPPAKKPRTTSRSPRCSLRKGTAAQGQKHRRVHSTKTTGRSSRLTASRRRRAGVDGASYVGVQESILRLLFVVVGLGIAAFCVLVMLFVVYIKLSAGTVASAEVARRSRPGGVLRAVRSGRPAHEDIAAGGAAIPENAR
ncbi:hypothetical protein MRX96_055605 [Rhipicephalus microplus]